MSANWMIYGANGYTGELTARLAVSRGLRPVLAGRSAKKIKALSAELDLDYQVFPLIEPEHIAEELQGVDLVLHMAGPFSATSSQMVEACIRSRTHYLDITGEIEVFEAVAERDEDARGAGVVLLPGVGFDVVPSDCLAAKLVASLPDANALVLAFSTSGRPSPGTTKTMIEGISKGRLCRRNGLLQPVPRDQRKRSIPFPGGEREASAIAWGDISTAWQSTGVPNITVYASMRGMSEEQLEKVSSKRRFFRNQWIQQFMKWIVGRSVKGPSEVERKAALTSLWGEAVNERGDSVTGALITPDGYDLTADAALLAVEGILEGSVKPGATTPSKAFGASFIDKLDNVECIPVAAQPVS